MKNLLIIAMAFIVPLATILLYIAADQGLMKLVKWFKSRRQAKKLNLKQTASEPVARPVLLPIKIEGKSEAPTTNAPSKHNCQRCKGCKHLGKGKVGCRVASKSAVAATETSTK